MSGTRPLRGNEECNVATNLCQFSVLAFSVSDLSRRDKATASGSVPEANEHAPDFTTSGAAVHLTDGLANFSATAKGLGSTPPPNGQHVIRVSKRDSSIMSLDRSDVVLHTGSPVRPPHYALFLAFVAMFIYAGRLFLQLATSREA